MNEQERLEAYYNLIFALMNCQTEEEFDEVIQKGRHLLDEGLVLVMRLIAGELEKNGRQQEAEKLSQWATEISIALQGANNQEGLYEQLRQAVSQLYQAGKYEQAIPLAEQALTLAKKMYGEEHPAVATSLNNLGLLYSSMGRYEEAERYYEQALAIFKRLLGEEHPHVATSLNNLAGLYQSMCSDPQS